MDVKATLGYGVARNVTQARYPQLWRGLVGLWIPSVGLQGMQLIDFSPMCNPMSFSSGVGPVPNWTYKSGRPGCVVSISSADASYLIALKSGRLLANATTFTAMGWANQTTIPAVGALFGAYADSTHYFSIENWSDGVFYAEIYNVGGGEGHCASSFVGAGAWFHWAVVVALNGATNTDKLKVYLNGNLMTLSYSGTFTSTLSAVETPLRIGNYSSFFFTGFVDDVRLYNRALSQGEIRLSMLASPLEMRAPDPMFKYTALVPTGSIFRPFRFAMPLVAGIGVGGAASSLLTGLVGYWKLDEASGNRADSSGLGSTMIPTGSISGATGIIGNGASLASANLQCATNANLQMGDIDFTITFWIKFSSLGGTILCKDNGTKYEYDVYYLSGTNTIKFYMDGAVSGSADVNSGVSISIGTWYFVCAQHDSVANLARISINNGSFASTAFSGGPFVTTTGNLAIGSESGGGSVLIGAVVDEVGIWKRVLTAGEITTLYKAGAGITYPF